MACSKTNQVKQVNHSSILIHQFPLGLGWLVFFINPPLFMMIMIIDFIIVAAYTVTIGFTNANNFMPIC